MFGYVRPLRNELKCGDFDLYRATYCGLCRCLRKRYGPVAPMFLTFDFTFLTLLLWEPEEKAQICSGRCHANPLAKKPMCPDSDALNLAADESMILIWWKIQDAIQDNGVIEGVPARSLSLLLYPSYQKARKLRPDFDQTVASSLKKLSLLEQENCPSIDRTADTFAKILSSAMPEDDPRSRVLGQLLYHLGRWIYLIDARDDFLEDIEKRRYNPLVLRYGAEGNDHELKLTLDHSLELMGAALQLGEFGCRMPILENIIYLGLPLVQRAVFDGSWTEIKKQQKIWRYRQ